MRFLGPGGQAPLGLETGKRVSEDGCCVVAKSVVGGRDGTSEGGAHWTSGWPQQCRCGPVAAIAFRNDTAICVDCPLTLLPAGVVDAPHAFGIIGRFCDV
jgi:hypothetical protein